MEEITKIKIIVEIYLTYLLKNVIVEKFQINLN